MLLTDLTSKAILKEMVSLAIGKRKTFCQKPQTTPKTPVQPSTSGAGQTLKPVVTDVPSTPSPHPHPYLPHL